MTTVSDIVDAIGTKALAAAVGRGETAVFNAKKQGVFPSAWRLVVRQECEKKKIDCPENLFSFILPSGAKPQNGEATP